VNIDDEWIIIISLDVLCRRNWYNSYIYTEKI